MLVQKQIQNQEHQPGLRELNKAGERVKILVVPTNEELEIARQCADIL